MIIGLAALGENREIGQDNKLPWHIPTDMAFFRKKISDQMVLVGRKTYESMGERPLRRCQKVFVLSQRKKMPLFSTDHILLTRKEEVFEHLPQGVKEKKEDPILWILGGSAVYEAFLNEMHQLWLTHIQATYPQADSFFPNFQAHGSWRCQEEIVPPQPPKETPCIFRLWEKV